MDPIVQLCAGESEPQGRDAVGWRIGVHWVEDQIFYPADVLSFDVASGRHLLLYDDGASLNM